MLRKIIIGCLIILVLGGIGREPGFSKCEDINYHVMGTVISDSNSPIEGALVLVFFDDYPYGYPGYSSATGHFRLSCWYDTYSGRSFFGIGCDQCDRRPRSISVVSYAKGYSVRRTVFEVGQPDLEKNEQVFHVAPIRLARIQTQRED